MFVVKVCTFVPQAIADMVTEENLAEGRLYPPLSTIREVSFKIAVKVGGPSTGDIDVCFLDRQHFELHFFSLINCFLL